MPRSRSKATAAAMEPQRCRRRNRDARWIRASRLERFEEGTCRAWAIGAADDGAARKGRGRSERGVPEPSRRRSLLAVVVVVVVVVAAEDTAAAGRTRSRAEEAHGRCC